MNKILKMECFAYLTYCLFKGKKKNDYKTLCEYYEWKNKKK